MARKVKTFEQSEKEKQLAITIIFERGGYWREIRKGKVARKVSAQELAQRIAVEPNVSFNRSVTKILINLVNPYGVVYDQIFYEWI